MELFDSHFHFKFGDETPEDYMKSCQAAGVKYLLAAASDFNESLAAEKFADIIANSWFTAGIHPHNASSFLNISIFEQFLNKPKLAAIGEIGLDYYYLNSECDTQIRVFRIFLDFALKNNLPAIVHCRDKDGSDKAYRDAHILLSDFSKSGGRFVLHCFTGTSQWAGIFLELGAFFGVSGIITFPTAKSLGKTLSAIPEDRLLIETDSPYLAPVPYRGKINRSEYLIEIAKSAASLKNIPLDKFAELTTANTKRFFKINE